MLRTNDPRRSLPPWRRLFVAALSTITAVAVIGLWCVPAPAQPADDAMIAWVAEGELPDGMVAAFSGNEVEALDEHPAGAAARAALMALLADRWDEIRRVDLEALSSWHLEATRRWEVPAAPVFGEARLLAASGDALYVAIWGPRLPATFDIVHRHLVFFGRYETATGRLSNLAVSIHAGVQER